MIWQLSKWERGAEQSSLLMTFLHYGKDSGKRERERESEREAEWGREGEGEMREMGRGEETSSVSLGAPAGGSSSCLPSQRRFLLHFKWWYSSITGWQLHQASCKHAKPSSLKHADANAGLHKKESFNPATHRIYFLFYYTSFFSSRHCKINTIHFRQRNIWACLTSRCSGTSTVYVQLTTGP